MAQIQKQTISFTISKLVKGKDPVLDLNVIESEHKEAIIELLEQTLGNEFIVEEA